MSDLPALSPLLNNPTEDEPEIILDKDKNIFRFSGSSMPEDPDKVFYPVIEWIKSYILAPNPSTVIEFKMDYFNSSSARFFVEILEMFEEIYDEGSAVQIIWFYFRDDMVMLERGEDLEAVVGLPFEFKLLDPA
jgi:hypothetical protein